MATDGLSRIDKLFVDRDQTDPRASRERRESFGVSICCGPDVANSYTLQLAGLTLASLMSRCFPGAVQVVLDEALQGERLRLWPALNLSLRDAFIGLLGETAVAATCDRERHAVVLGNGRASPKDLRLTFDGWIAQVGPSDRTERLAERQYCPLVGVFAASLAASELFLSFAGISIEACRRPIAMSLWKPGADVRDPGALGVPVEYLPKSLWVLGLGHLGNAYLWSLATLPYADPTPVTFHLNDYDSVEKDNLETCILFGPEARGLKTRVCEAWLAARGFQTRLVERAFDASFRCREANPAAEPRLALCGFDSNLARRDLASANFLRVVESGLGNTSTNFDTLSMHTLPNPRAVDNLWPDLSQEEAETLAKERERIARENCGYLALSPDECGRYELAGKSVGVPFVGTAAASFVIAEVLRLFHAGARYTDLKVSLASPAGCFASSPGPYAPGDFAGLEYAPAATL